MRFPRLAELAAPRVHCLSLLAVLIYVLSFPAHLRAEDNGWLEEGTPAPGFTLKGFDEKTYRLEDCRGKKVVLLDFGRFTCIPCRSVVKDLEKLHKKYKNKGVQIFSVNLDGPFAKTAVPKGIAEFKLTFPVLLDTRLDVAEAYKVRSIPHLVLIDRKGIVRLNHFGYTQDLEKILSTHFDKNRSRN